MNDLQCWLCVGTIAEDAVLKYTATQYPILNFRLHSQRSFEVKGQVRAEVLDADCTVLGDLGKNLALQLKAGVRVMVRGRWKLSIWTDQKSGQERRRHVVTVDEVDVLSSVGATAAEAPIVDDHGSPF